jgi:hypothetical protein
VLILNDKGALGRLVFSFLEEIKIRRRERGTPKNRE